MVGEAFSVDDTVTIGKSTKTASKASSGRQGSGPSPTRHGGRPVRSLKISIRVLSVADVRGEYG